ncbi:MAG: TonB-dependent siderophore receptor [Methylocystaceae bacterium]|nr:TonB-dependent siderophore receptor [Methylocystaceae bacterium]
MTKQIQSRNASQRKKLKALLLAGTFLALAPYPALAQSDEQTNTTSQDITLAPLVVEGSSYETEGTGSYSSNLVSVGEKDVLTVREIPQSTHVLTRDRLEDGGFTSLDTALRRTPGITVLSNDDGRSSIFSRGFEYDNLYFNGLPAPLSSIYGTQPDMAIVDHVEILRGPQGLYGGTGEPTGTVNMRLKQAQKEFGGSVALSGGSWDTYRADADITGALTENGALRGRLVAAKSKSQGWIKGAENAVDVAYGTLAADLTDQTTLTFSISHMGRDIKPHNGLPTYADGSLIDAPVDTYTGADWSRFDNDVNDYILELEHKFNDGGHAKASMRYADRDVDFLYLMPLASANSSGNISRVRALSRIFAEESLALDAHISKPFELAGMDSNFIIGMDYRGYESDMQQGLQNVNGTFNIFNWNPGAVAKPTISYTTDQTTDSDQLGIYTNFRISPLDPWTVIAGARVSWYQSELKNNKTGVISDEIDIDNKFTPYLGTTFDLTDNFTAYGSYTSIFQPQDDTDSSGKVIDPREGNQFEVGIKGATLSGDTNGSLALFRINDENRSITDPNDATANIAAGEVVVEGLEAEIGGRLVDGVEVSAGYTFTLSEDKDTGSTFSYWTPKHMFQLATKYDVGTHFKEMDGLDIGGHLKAFGDFSAVSSGTTIAAPGYTVVDAFASYDINESLTASFNIDNLMDKEYYERVASTNLFNFYGKPRTFTVKLQAKF